MGTSKGKTAADNKSLQKQNETALKVSFPRAMLLKQFEKMAKATGSETEAANAKRETAFIVCQSAAEYRGAAFGTDKGQTEDITTILDSWRESWKTLIIDLHKAGSPFVELGEANKKGEQKPVMTGYGRNVASAARGMIEHDIAVQDDKGENRAYTDMTKSIVSARRESLPEDKRTVNAAKDTLRDAMTALRKKIGQDAEGLALLVTVLTYCQETIEEHGIDGMAALSLALEDIDLNDYFAEETEETETDDSAIAEDSGTEVQIAAA